MIREASTVGVSGALPGAGEKQDSPQHRNSNNHSAPLDEEDDWSPSLGDKNEVLMQLAQTKVSLAQVEGKLAEAKRDLSRMRELNNALNARVESLTEERDKSWHEVCFSLPVSALIHSAVHSKRKNSILIGPTLQAHQHVSHWAQLHLQDTDPSSTSTNQSNSSTLPLAGVTLRNFLQPTRSIE